MQEEQLVLETPAHLSADALEAGLPEILRAPADNGALLMIVARPKVHARQVLSEAVLDVKTGLAGDSWYSRYEVHDDKTRQMQLTLMNARVTALIAQDKAHWPLAGDQLYVDMDLSDDNLPAGTRLALGSAIIEISAEPHTGCKKFVERFGQDAMIFVNSRRGKALNLRGVNASVIQGGTVRTGDRLRKLPC